MEEFPNRHNREIRPYDRTAPPKDKEKAARPTIHMQHRTIWTVVCKELIVTPYYKFIRIACTSMASLGSHL